MQAWALLQIMFSLALAACGLALIIGKLHAKEQEEWKPIRDKIASLKRQQNSEGT